MADYYVSAGTTTPAATHADITAVNADAGITSGDNVYFYRGETFNDASLVADAGVTYDAYGIGDDPIIDGVDTRDCITVGTANDVTIQNLELINGLRCLEVTGTGTGLNVNNCVMRGSATDTITTECIYTASTGAGHTYSDITIYQPHNVLATAKGMYVTNGSSTALSNISFLGVAAKNSYSALEVINGTGTITLDNVSITGWNGRGGSTSRVVYLRGAPITSTLFTMTDCDGAFYCKEATGGGASVFTQLDISGITGLIQTESGGHSLTVNSGTWTNSDTSFSSDTLVLNNISVIGKRINITSTVATADLTDCTVSNSDVDGIATSGILDTLTNCIVTGAASRGIISADGATTLRNCSATNCGDDGLRSEGAAVVTDYMGVYSNNEDDGVSANGTGSITCIGTVANDNGSIADVTSGDGYTSHNTSTLNLYGCTASGNWKSGVGTTDASGGIIYNCSFYNNFNTSVADDWGLYINGSGGWTIRNCVTEGHLLEINVTAAAVLGGVTIDYGCYNNTRTADLAFNWNGTAYNWADYLTNSGQDANSLNDDPEFTDKANYDLSLKATSPCVGAGLAGLGNYIGADGEPFSSFGRDIGGIQSAHGPFHPVNL